LPAVLLERRRRENHLLSETQVIDAIRKAHHEFSVCIFDPGSVALLCQVRHLRLDMCQCNGFNGLSKGHVRLYDSFSIWHVELVAQQKAGVERDL
jgi:hypothetical protein